MKPGPGTTPAGRRASLLDRMNAEARRSRVTARRVHLVVAIDRFLARLLERAPNGSWVVKGGYANQLRRPDDARFTADLDLKIEAAIEEAPALLAAGFAVDLSDDFGYEAAAAPLQGPPGGGLRFVVVSRFAGTLLVQFKVDVSAADMIVGDLEAHLSDPVLERLGFPRSRFPVYPVAQHVAEKLHALTLPRDTDNTRARDLVDLAWFIRHFTFSSDGLIDACVATFEHRASHAWPPDVPEPPTDWRRPYERWRAELDLRDPTPREAAASLRTFLAPSLFGHYPIIVSAAWCGDSQGTARVRAVRSEAFRSGALHGSSGSIDAGRTMRRAHGPGGPALDRGKGRHTTMAIDATRPRTRRALLGAGLGAIAATAASAVGQTAATKAANDPVLLGQPNPATGTTSISTTSPVAFSCYSKSSVALVGESKNFRGGLFSGKLAQVRLNPSSAATHPGSGERGDLFVDRSGRLWFCKGRTTWKQLA